MHPIVRLATSGAAGSPRAWRQPVLAMALAVATVALVACGGGGGSSSGDIKGAQTNGDAKLQTSGKLAGSVTLVGSVNCTGGGQSMFLSGNIGTTSVSLSAGSTKAGQSYTFPQAAGTPGAFITFTSVGSPGSTWIAGSEEQPGKGTVTVTDTGGTIDLDLGSATDGTEHVSGSWTCAS